MVSPKNSEESSSWASKPIPTSANIGANNPAMTTRSGLFEVVNTAFGGFATQSTPWRTAAPSQNLAMSGS